MAEAISTLEKIGDEEVMSAKQVAQYLSISRGTLYNILKRDEDFPHPFSITPGQKRWKRAEVDKWLFKKMK
jgi:predicted DNA-binding transcriptional regulator AlpA